MRTPDQVRERIATTWRRQWTEWLGGGGDWPKVFALDPPTERGAQQRWAEFVAWVKSWAPSPLGGQVTTVSRNWSTMGQQQVPTHLSFASAPELAAAVSRDAQNLFEAADRRWRERAAAWPDLAETLRGLAEWMAKLSEPDFTRFIAVVDWLSANRDSGLYVRQLPIAGMDSKWVERHAGPLARLLSQRFECTGALPVVAGLAVDAPCRRVRILDPELRSMVAGLSDLTVRLGELATLPLPVRLALVVENQQTALACQDLPGTVVLMGGGFSVTELGRVPWLERVPILYWGDIDTAGLAILAALRCYHPHTVACLMDEATLRAHRELWSEENNPVHVVAAGLHPDEATLHRDLLEGSTYGRKGVRLEQERLPWPEAWRTVEFAASEILSERA